MIVNKQKKNNNYSASFALVLNYNHIFCTIKFDSTQFPQYFIKTKVSMFSYGYWSFHEILTDLFFCELQQFILGFLHVIFGSPKHHLVVVGPTRRELYGYTSTVFHDGTNEATFSANNCVMQFMWDNEFLWDDACLQVEKQWSSCYWKCTPHFHICYTLYCLRNSPEDILLQDIFFKKNTVKLRHCLKAGSHLASNI